MFTLLAVALAGISLGLLSGCNAGSSEGVLGPPMGTAGLYVNGATGSDANDGSSGMPMATLAAALLLAQDPSWVLVAEGTYSVDSTPATDTNAVLSAGVSLKGGYSSDFMSRDPVTHVTTIEDTGSGAITTPNAAVMVPGSVDSTSVVEGFILKGTQNSSTTDSAALFIALSSTVVVQGNVIMAGKGSNNTYGIRTKGSPTIRDNVILGGDNGAAIVYAVSSAGGSPLIERNTIDGGWGGASSYGINLMNSSATVQNNLVFGGDSTVTTGILSDSGTDILRNNIINGGADGNQVVGIIIKSGSPEIINNIVSTASGTFRACIVEALAASNPSKLSNNDLYDCPSGAYADHTLSTGTCTTYTADNCYASPTDLNDATKNTQGAVDTAGGNLIDNPNLLDAAGPDNDVTTMEDNDWHYSASSLCALTQGGKDLSASLTTDKDGMSRPGADGFFSIGAFEPTLVCVIPF
jgi:Protein of unknown function (DUF1565)